MSDASSQASSCSASQFASGACVAKGTSIRTLAGAADDDCGLEDFDDVVSVTEDV